MNIKNRTIKHWVLFLLLFLPVTYLFFWPLVVGAIGSTISVAGVLKLVPALVGIIIGIVTAAAIFWFAVDRAGKAENQITEEEAYYYYDYPNDDRD